MLKFGDKVMVNKIKQIVELLQASLTAEDKKKLSEIANAYYATVDENFSLREENAKLKQKILDKEIQIKELNDRLEEKQKLKFESKDGEAGYYLQLENKKVGPICPLCYKSKNAISILEKTSKGAFCPICKNTYAGVKAIVEGEYSRVW